MRALGWSRPSWTTLPLTLLLTLGCGGEAPPPAEVIRPVRTLEVTAIGGPRLRTLSGTARAGVEAQLSFRVPGTVERLPVAVGEAVARGQLLASLDPSDYRLQEQQAVASLAQAEAQRRNAEASYERVRALYENNNASVADLDAARAGAESANAGVAAAEQGLELARSQLRYTRLSSPLAGAVAAVKVEVNENVNAGQGVVTLTAGARPEVAVAMPEILLPQLDPEGPVAVRFDALPGQDFPAVITEVGVAVTGTATTFPVKVRLEQEVPAVRSGMAAEVAFRFTTGGGAWRIVVPAVAVAEDRQGRFVYLVEAAAEGFGTARRRQVEVGELTTEGLVVEAGLEGGELLITAGVSRLRDGQRVRLLPGVG